LTDGPSTLSRWFARTSKLNPSARALLFEKRNSDIRRIADVRPNIRQRLDPRPIGNVLKCYLEGWAEANSAKILAATAPAIISVIPSLEVFFGRLCMSISISCRIDYLEQE
jgi:hypothetical protein